MWTGLIWVSLTLECVAAVLLLGERKKWDRLETIAVAGLFVNVLTFMGVLVAYGALTVADDRSRIEHRGQLITGTWKIDRLDNATGPVVSFTLTNCGNTPTYILQGTYEAVLSIDLPDDFAQKSRRLPRLPGILGKGQESSIVISEQLPPINSEALREGTWSFYLRAVLAYRDIFGTRYELRSTAKFGKIIKSNGDADLGFEFPEKPLSVKLWDIEPKEFVKLRQYNSHKRIED
jgi:hypothetical protein